ncbi:MAG: caspase family protein [Elusimicrobia bacterium]|nr:caspase family protein [Elusimicrobiota bacterium]
MPAVLAAAFLSACASSPRIVHLSPPGESLEESHFAGEELYLKEFTVKNKASSDTKEAEAGLRAQFIEHLLKQGRFSKVVDATSPGMPVPPGSLSMSAGLQLSIQDDHMSYNKAILSMYTLWSIYPRKGSVTIIGNATTSRAGRTLSSRSWTSMQEFSYVLFGGLRTGPIQEAFKACYEDIFTHISVPMSPEGGPGVSKGELETLVKASVEKATRKEEKAYDSDADKATYKAPESPDDFAVVVGIEKYMQVPQADFGERDAQSMREHLSALGFPQRNIVHLSGSMATKSNLEKYLEHWLPEKVNESSKVVFYFSGHGAPDIDSKQAFLVPWDADVKFLRQTGYPLKKLYAQLNGLKAKEVLVVLDSCFSGAGGRSVLPKGARPLVAQVDEGLEQLGKLVILSASEGSEIALSDDKQGHGLFTYHLLKGLNEKMGASTVKALYEYLVPRVQDGARQQNRDQTPKLSAADAGLGAMSLGR